MVQLLAYLIFIICVALASGSVILSARLRNTFKNEVFSALLYYLVFLFTFGFYGIWGQVVIKTFLSDIISEELLTRFSDFSVLLGLPFIVFGWLMLIRFALLLSGRVLKNWFIVLFLFINMLMILLLGYLTSGDNVIKASTLNKYFFAGTNLVYSIGSSILILFSTGKEKMISSGEQKKIALLIITVMIFQCVPLLFYSGQTYLGLIYILTFFAGISVLPVYLNYGISRKAVPDEQVTEMSFDDFCNSFEISPREKDIISGVCNGLSNKEISEKLFITIQTVKDHTHRIYIKTNVKSRAQLMNLVKGFRPLNQR